MRTEKGNIMNNRGILCSDGDKGFSTLVREEYGILGATVNDLAKQLDTGKYHAQSLWDGTVAWTLPEWVGAIAIPHFGEGVTDPIAHAMAPYLTSRRSKVAS